MFNLALKWGKADENPAQPVEFLRENNGRLRYLERDRIAKLLDNCSPTLKNMVELVLNTGLRKSELLHLKWRDIDLKNKLLFVWDTKNKESKSIPLNSRVIEVFKRIPRNLRSEYVFPSPVDQSKPWVDIRKEWSKALKKTNIENFTFHDLRHTFASHLVMAGVDLKTVQELLGHKRIEMTLRYAHLSPFHKRRGVDILCKHYEEREESIPKVSQASN
jgi:integrase